jgi:hypothetical protein
LSALATPISPIAPMISDARPSDIQRFFDLSYEWANVLLIERIMA